MKQGIPQPPKPLGRLSPSSPQRRGEAEPLLGERSAAHPGDTKAPTPTDVGADGTGDLFFARVRWRFGNGREKEGAAPTASPREPPDPPSGN